MLSKIELNVDFNNKKKSSSLFGFNLKKKKNLI